MFNLQGSEIIVILLLALVVLGPEKLPDAIRRFTQTYNELKKMGTGFQSEMKSALDAPMREMRETADLLRESVDPDRLEAESAAEAELQRTAEAEANRMAAIDEVESAVANETPGDVSAPAKPINQIAQANARGKVEPTVAAPADVDLDAVPTFVTGDEHDDRSEATDDEAVRSAGDDIGADAPGDDANEASMS